MVYQNILLDEKQNSELQKEGFVVLPFLNEGEISELVSFFNQKITLDEGSFYATAHAKEVHFRNEMSHKIVEVIQEKVDSCFKNHQLLGASYIVKSKGLSQALQPHQDWNIVDESMHRSYNIWIPLVDLDEENGVILVMPKSHAWITNYRHSSIPCSFQQVHEQIWANMQPLFLKAGEALIYDHALLHASKPNISQSDRIACACGIIPINAEMKFYWNNDGIIEEYESFKEFFLKENVFTGPHGLSKTRTIENGFFSVDENHFFELTGIEKTNIVTVDSTEIGTEILDKKSFWKVYSIPNIVNEIRGRIKQKL